ncbi:MAG: DUF951 domain-containing protein [Lachnospiraceae bacterium]|jgi:hypothetical protein|nr:DUF951 domain-containing protein [Lachnospiraceae bacterium]
MYFEVGDRIKMKKAHPCGSHEWGVLRVGIDFRLRCEGCGHQIMVPRTLVEKNCRGVMHEGEGAYHKPEARKPDVSPHA